MCILGDKQELIAELCHKINSPLAAMRNAVYLASTRVQDAAVLEYLALANDEITAVAAILRESRVAIESLAKQTSVCREAECPIVTHRKGNTKARAAAASMPATGRAA